jgi:hypothetical protein
MGVAGGVTVAVAKEFSAVLFPKTVPVSSALRKTPAQEVGPNCPKS